MSSNSRLRPSVLAAREQLETNKLALHRLHRNGMPSVQTCARISSGIDGIVMHLFNAVLEDVPPATETALRQRLSLVALGGYGRRQMSPHSDVDLMILYTGTLDQPISEFASRLTQDMYDAGLQPGLSLRNPPETVRLARDDAVILTSLIETRLIAGSSAPLEAFQASFLQLIQRRPTPLCKAIIEARREERARYGETVFTLEPNIKRSPGGLRDLHLLRWLWFVKTGEPDLGRLLLKGVLSKFDHRRLVSSQNFLLQVRNELHFESNNRSDVLTRAEQIRIAEALRVRGREGLRPVEHFMRDYFRHTSHVSFLTTRMCDLVSPPPAMSRMLAPVLEQNLSEDYRCSRREISATQQGMSKLKQRLAEAIRLVDLARQYHKRIAQDTWYCVYRAAPQYSTQLESETVERFCNLLTNPDHLGEALRRMHDLGILEKVIPDFTHARCLLQFNCYHKYTVDEHCIRAVAEATQFAKRKDPVGETYRQLKRKQLLHLALLLHDLGKGFKEDHAQLGAEIARRVGKRLQLTVEEYELVAQLILDHLKMSHAAFRRDTSDTALIEQFAHDIGNQERLDMLYLLTCADMAAVGPDVLNAWRAGMLSDLHRRIRQQLAHGDAKLVQNSHKLLRHRVWSHLAPQEQSAPWFEHNFWSLPESFITSREPQEVVFALRQFHSLSSRNGIAWGRYVADSKTVEFTAGVSDGAGRGVFSAMAGVLSSRGMSILAAETAVLQDNLLLLRYQATDTQATGPSDEDRLASIADAMVQAIDSDEPPTFRRIWGSEQAHKSVSLTDLPVEVRLNEHLSQQMLIIEVFTFDRIGLLYELARSLHELELKIHFAKIGTYLDQVVDVFYVSEATGAKPQGQERLQTIQDRLQAIIKPPSL